MTSQCEGRAPAKRSMATTSRAGDDAHAVVDHPLGRVGLLLVEHREHVPRRPGADGAVAALDAFQHVHAIVFPLARPVVSSAPLRAARRARIRGRLAQRESARLTRGRSLVQIQHRPPPPRTAHHTDTLTVCRNDPAATATCRPRPFIHPDEPAPGRLLFPLPISSVAHWPSPRHEAPIAVVQPSRSRTRGQHWNDDCGRLAGWSRRTEVLVRPPARTSPPRDPPLGTAREEPSS